MSEWLISVTARATVTVEADTEKEALEMALEQAIDEGFTDSDAEVLDGPDDGEASGDDVVPAEAK